MQVSCTLIFAKDIKGGAKYLICLGAKMCNTITITIPILL